MPFDPTRFRMCLCVVFGFALLLRLTFVAEVVSENKPSSVVNFCADSPEYLILANNLNHGFYAGEDSREAALSRTPGYPAFCSIFLAFGGTSFAILFAQAFLSALIPIMVFLFVFYLIRNKAFALFAGGFSAVSLTGIGLSGMILSDLLLGTLFLAGMFFLYRGVMLSHVRYQLLSGLFFGIAQLVKPVLFLWPLVSWPVWFLFGRSAGTPFVLKRFLIFVAIQVAFSGVWVLHNGFSEGTFIMSSIGAKTMRYYLASQVDTRVHAGEKPQAEAINQTRNNVRERFRTALQNGTLSLRDYPGCLQKESLRIFLEHPWLTVVTYADNIKENATGGWDYFEKQLPVSSPFRTALLLMTRLENRIRLIVSFFVLGLLGYSAIRYHLFGKKGLGFNLLALSIPILYFNITSGITFWTGPRIQFPIECFWMILAVVAFWTILSRERFRKP